MNVGIAFDIMQRFLDTVIEDSVSNSFSEREENMESGHTTPTASNPSHGSDNAGDEGFSQLSSTNLARAMVHDVSVEVVVAPFVRGPTDFNQKPERNGSDQVTVATCIISIWEIEDARYFTLTFTSATATSLAKGARPSSRIVNRTNTEAHLNKSRSSGSSSSSGHHSGNSSNPSSKVVTPMLQPPDFPPRGPPSKGRHDISASASIFQKATQLKDAILNAINMPAYGS